MYWIISLVLVGIFAAVFIKNSDGASVVGTAIKGIAGKFAGIFKQK